MPESPSTFNHYELFLVALKHCLKQQGRGSKKKLADYLEVTPTYMSYILREDDRRRQMGQASQVKTAEFFGFSYLEFLNLGDHLQKGELFFGTDFALLKKHSPERADKVIHKAATDAGFNNAFFATYRNLQVSNIPELTQYINEELTDVEFYEKLLILFQNLISKKEDK